MIYCLNDLLDKKIYGFTETDELYSKMIRIGKLTRDEAISRIKNDDHVDPLLINEVLNILHVNKKFNSKLSKKLGLSSGIKRIFIVFEIDKKGKIVNAKARAPHQGLIDEAIRVVNSLPKMKPGKENGIIKSSTRKTKKGGKREYSQSKTQ